MMADIDIFELSHAVQRDVQAFHSLPVSLFS